jgi:hypothetical protein
MLLLWCFKPFSLLFLRTKRFVRQIIACRKNYTNSYTKSYTLGKARRTRAHLSRVLVIRDKLDRQNFLVCGQHLRHFRHSWHVNQISNMFDIFRHSWQKNSRVWRANDKRAWIGKFAHFCRSNMSRITSTRDKCARVRRA